VHSKLHHRSLRYPQGLEGHCSAPRAEASGPGYPDQLGGDGGGFDTAVPPVMAAGPVVSLDPMLLRSVS
jgi:hypothetical protein